MERLLLTISRANGLNSELFKDVIGVLEQALCMARTSRSTAAPTSRCQFCPLAPEITRYDTFFVFESLTCSLESPTTAWTTGRDSSAAIETTVGVQAR